MPNASDTQPRCSIARTMQVLGEKWTVLIVRSAFQGDSRFSEFRDRLGVPTDVLSARLTTLVDAGIFERRSYKEAGSRERSSYHLTEAGSELKKVLAALSEWGTAHRASEFGPSALYVDQNSDEVSVEFVSASGVTLDCVDVTMIPGPGATTTW
ncbi:transcriptional regulator, HxlR family [Agreia bicolorata]|uniref:Transcriptional regulator, HxlR family n=1 Tax=Agreia bicolorata TaxID=110935 RepID=A0A1T4XK39_9MICO|nr:helix-turn-helix domain-containing protein [Agreia bicolorata]SKA89864.1 transcriptional regulator, HxlR family [Agreia bicolorata]